MCRKIYLILCFGFDGIGCEDGGCDELGIVCEEFDLDLLYFCLFLGFLLLDLFFNFCDLGLVCDVGGCFKFCWEYLFFDRFEILGFFGKFWFIVELCFVLVEKW